MATFNWAALTNGQSIAFNPTADVLTFDASFSAEDLNVNFPAGQTNITVGSKTVTLQTDFRTLTTTNVTFADGSFLLVGDNTTGTANDHGANTLTGAGGADRFYGLGGNDNMSGLAGADTFVITPQSPAFGNDTVNGGADFDTITYGTSVTGAANVDLRNGIATNAAGTTTLVSIETVLGTAQNDVLVGGDATHRFNLFGDTVTERFRGREGSDTITGASELGFFTVADYADNSNTEAIDINLATGVAVDGMGGTDTLTHVDGVRGGSGNDVIRGGSMSRTGNGTFFELLRGNAGNDTLNGNNAGTGGLIASTDRADYSNSTAAVIVNLATGVVANDGFGGMDTLIDIDQVYGGSGNDTLTGGSGNDQFDGGFGTDTLDGAGGSDEARFQQSSAAVRVNLSSGAVTLNGVVVNARTANDGMGGTDTLISIEQVRGSDFADFFRGSDDTSVREFFSGDAGNDVIDGGAGIDIATYNNIPLDGRGGLNAFLENGSGTIDDKLGGTDTLINIEGLQGSNWNDVLTGGAGDQWLRGRGSSDTLNGGAGSDWASYSGDPIGVTINLSAGTATDGWAGPGGLLGLGGTDTLISIENAEGSDFVDGIVGSAEANELRGRDGNDQLVALSGNDVVNGGAGDDQMDGGGGYDTAAYTESPTSLVVTQGAAGYKVIAPNGTDAVEGVERLQVSNGFRLLNSVEIGDFNGDGNSDLAIRNHGNGDVDVLLMNGTNIADFSVNHWGTDWRVVGGDGDFNGDAKSDIVLRNDLDGRVGVLLMDGKTPTAFQSYNWGLNWQVMDAEGDFNNDGRSDLVIRNDATGDVDVVLMTGVNISAFRAFAWGTEWNVIDGESDFNNDSKSDLVIRNNTSGDVGLVLMDGLNIADYATYALGTDSQVVDASADFNADDRSDLLVRNEVTGAVDVRLMNGVNTLENRVYNFGDQWQVADSGGDFNNDNRSDLVLRNDVNGKVDVVLMNGDDISTFREYNFGTDWRVVDAEGDFNNDGRDDMVLRNHMNGDVYALQMNGTDIAAQTQYHWGTSWDVIS